MRIGAILGAIALAGCAAASADSQSGRQAKTERELAEALKGRVAGKPQSCISATGADGPRVIDQRTLLYRDGRRIWRNDLPANCPGLDDDDLLIVEIHGSQICRHDRFRANPRGSVVPGPYCTLGSFTPYTKPR
ncbi:DUF6491 family protein [Sphingomonas sp.]|jgi:hypothetical protein|uniref:DUF6491 family protein n=1 Tax=Sphingomonas sp. TaxID=28214 RepID=UPI002ED9AB4B